MGYSIDMISDTFVIKKENIENAFLALKEFMKTKNKLAWVDPKFIVEADDVFEAFDEIRFPLATNENGDYVIDYFNGESLGDDEEILNSIARYVEKDSYIEFSGEDGDIWRYVFDGEKCVYKSPQINWD